MNPEQLARRIRQNDPLQGGPIKARFAIIAFFMLTAVVFLPVFELEHLLIPVLVACFVGVIGNCLSLVWVAWGRGIPYRIYFATFIDVLLITIALHYLGGIEESFSWVYAVALMVIASRHGLRIGIYAAGISSLMYTALLIGEFSGLIHHVGYNIINPVYIFEDPFYLKIKLLSSIVLFFVTSVVSGLLSERLLRSRQELESLVVERTTELRGANEQLRREITERKQTEERLKILFEFAPDAYYLNDLAGTFVDGNRAAEEMTGYQKEELLGKNFLELGILSPEQVPKAAALLARNTAGKPTGPDEFTLSRKDGEQVVVEISTYPVEFENQTLVLGLARDTTERKQADEALRESEDRYRTLVNNSLTAICLIQDEKILFANQRLIEMSEYTLEELVGSSPLDLVHPDDRELAVELAARRLSGQDAGEQYQYRAITKNGNTLWLETFGTKVDYRGKPAILANFLDITDRKLAEEALRESEEKYRLLVENAIDGIFIIQGGVTRFSSPAALKILGYTAEELATIPFLELIHPDERHIAMDRYKKRVKGEYVPSSHTFRMRNRAGEEFWGQLNNVLTSWKGKPAVLCFLKDITEQKRLEAQLQQAQRMESIGTLAGGIAHDFNNILGGILGYASLTRAVIPSDHKIYNYVETIERSAMRAAELTAQLLGFARGGKYKVAPVDLNHVVDDTMKIISRTLDKSIDIKIRRCERLPTVEADAGQLEQVLMNLCVNAGEAMPAGGTLTIETDVETMTDEYVKTHVGAKPGPCVSLSVTDSGIGMNKETRERIFEPFFTTKKEGKGTGLGLSMVYGVVKNHEGYVDVNSEPGHGTTFKIYLPVGGKPEKKESSEVDVPLQGDELILVVDDEEAIRSFMKEVFGRNGYRVLLAKDGAEAINIYQQHDGDIGLIILDMIMPKMGGQETFLRLRAHNPGVKVLLSTGYSQSGKAQEILDSGVMGFIQKPYRPNALLAKVRSVLDAKTPA